MERHAPRPGHKAFSAMRRRLDPALGIVCGTTALGVYLLTLAPDLIDIRDTPAFQYMGRILGVPHAPGYPLYMLISWAFSHVPVGSLAYRMNLLSAVFGAGTVALVYAVLRRVGCRRPVAAGIALASGFGPVTWSQCLIAEVYSLETLLIAASIVVVLRWQDEKRAGAFYGAAFLLGLAVAHHPSELLLAPGFLAFVWVADRRWLTNPRRVSFALASASAAFLPYVYLIVRASQHAAFVLEPAHTLGDVLRILSGARYSENLFPFDVRTVVGVRVPMAASLLVDELTPVGCAAALAGLAGMWRRRLPIGALLTLGVSAMLVFVVNYDIPDIAVFFIPVFLLSWIAAGAGVESALLTVERWMPRWAAAAGLACTLIPAWFIAAHGATVSLHDRIATARWADALFAQIRTPAVFLEEDWVVNEVIRYKTLGQGLPPGRTVDGPVPFDAGAIDGWLRGGKTIYAFGRATDLLRFLGWPLDPQVVRVPLQTYIESQPADSTVAVAVPAERSRELLEGAPALSTLIGIAPDRSGGRFEALAGVGVRGSASAGVEASDPHRARIHVTRGERIGRTSRLSPTDIEISAGALEAAILVDGREVVRTSRGIAVAVWGPRGELREARVAYGLPGPTVPLRWLPLSVVRGARRCEVAVASPVDVTSLASSGVLTVLVPADGRLVLDGGGADLFGLRIVDVIRGASVNVSVEATGAGRRAVFTSDRGASPAAPWAIVSLGGIPGRLSASWEPGSGEHQQADVCAVDTRGLVDEVDDRTLGVRMANDDQSMLVGGGWSKPAPSPAGPYREITAGNAALLVPLPDDHDWIVRLMVLPRQERGATRPEVGLRANASDLGSRPLAPGWQVVEWPLSSSATRAVNQFVVSASSPVAIGWITFTRR